MRCLIDWLYGLLFGIRTQTSEQHISDLEQMLSAQLEDQSQLQLEIIRTTHRLLIAHETRDELSRQQLAMRAAQIVSAVDREFPTPSPVVTETPMKKLAIFDCEIKHGVATEDNPAQPSYQYAKGWPDFAGMGISVIGAYDKADNRYRVFCQDNLHMWSDMIDQADYVVSFNGDQFDRPLLAAHGLDFPDAKNLDLAALIWQAAGIPEGEHPKGLGLDAICRANGIVGKTGRGADAPQHWQDGNIGRVIDYCLADVRCTWGLYLLIYVKGCILDPRNGKTLYVDLPE